MFNLITTSAYPQKGVAKLSHVQAIERHPGSSVGLPQRTTGRERFGTVEHPDVIQAKETTFKHVVAALVFTVHPPIRGISMSSNHARHCVPSEVEQQFLEDTFQERQVFTAVQLALNLEYTEVGP